MKGFRYFVPNLFTAINLSLGLASVFLAMEKNWTLAGWTILWSVLLDKADGTAARLLRSTSRFGFEFDSLADLVSFGLAPACLAYQVGRWLWGETDQPVYFAFLLLGSFAYVCCAAIRLARFNTIVPDPKKRYFRGIPTTLSGALVSALVLVALLHEPIAVQMVYLPGALILLGIGMISSLPVPKLLPRKNIYFNLFQILNIVFIYGLGITMAFPEYILGIALFYLLVGVIFGVVHEWGRERDSKAG